MSPSQCLFCEHVNPAGAKFCNDCGSQLHVKRCSRCGAVNDEAAQTCFKCEMHFEAPSPGSGASPMASAASTTGAASAASERLPFRFDFLDELPKSAPSTSELNAAALATGAREPSLATTISPATQLAQGAGSIQLDKLDRTSEPRPLDEASKPVGSAAERALRISAVSEPSFQTAPSPEPRLATPPPVEATEWRPRSRTTVAVPLIAAGLLATGILAYYVYSPSMHDGQDERAVSASPEILNPGTPPPRPIQEIGINASSAPPASVGTGSVDAIGSAKPPRPDETSTAATGQDAPAASGSMDADSPPRSPAAIGDPRSAPQPSACPEGVAALGLCGSNAKGKSK